MKRTITFLLVATLSLGLLTGCGGGNEHELALGVCFYKYDDTYVSSVRQALEKEAEGNVTLHLNDSKGDQGTQNDQVDLLIQKGVDALLVNLVDTGAAQTIVDKAKAANIPLIFFNREPALEVIESYEKCRFVGTNSRDAGTIQGNLVADRWEAGGVDKNGDGILQYVILKGEPDNPETVARSEYSIRAIEERGISTEELGVQVCNWDTELASSAMGAWLARFGEKIECVISNNDGMAQGAVSALQAVGYNLGGESVTVPVVGVDATDAAKELISQGFMYATVKQDAEAMANALFVMGMNAAEGMEFIENSEYNYDDTGHAVRIPYEEYRGA